MIWFLRRRGSVSARSLVEVLIPDLDGGESGGEVFNFPTLSLLELWLERLRNDKHAGTLSIFGRGEIRPELRSPDLHCDRLLSNNCLIFVTFRLLLQ
jgi:hypothetical protein